MNKSIRTSESKQRRETSINSAQIQSKLVNSLKLNAKIGHKQQQHKSKSNNCRNCGHTLGATSFICSNCLQPVQAGNTSCENPKPPEAVIDWDKIEETYRSRHERSCSICMEPFLNGNQVLLSCSHLFHSHCFQNLQLFRKSLVVGHLTSISCPLCRSEVVSYSMSSCGVEVSRRESARIIQRSWKRWLTQSQARHIILDSCGNHPSRDLEIYCATREMQVRNVHLNRVADKVDVEINDVINMIDLNIAQNQKIIDDAFDSIIRGRSVVFNEEEEDDDDDWTQIARIAMERISSSANSDNADLCPICMDPIVSGSKRRRISITSCGHVIHSKCLTSFQEFLLLQGNTQFACPVCRSSYRSKML